MPDDVNSKAAFATRLLHADEDSFRLNSEVVPSISVTTTFRTPQLPDASNFDPRNPKFHVYSRYTQSISTKVEKVLGSICNGYAITYASGLAAVYAALVHLRPRRIAISGGYHGCHAAIDVYRKSHQDQVQIVGIDDDLSPGDVVWLETPLNPTGEARDIRYYADRAHQTNATLVVDSTFAPPPLQDPFTWGADMVMHSGTKYFGGHSDLLSGVLVVQSEDIWRQLWNDRTYLGSMMGSLEAWLLLRSLRTLHLRIPRQSATATALVRWLKQISTTTPARDFDGVRGGIITKVWHSSIQEGRFRPESQMEGGYNATFAILMSSPEWASSLPFMCQYFTPATSLGGVESLIEQRVRSDPEADPRLIRISVGVEDLEDLKEDLRNVFRKLSSQAKL